ncbi:MAG: hypothetical protein ACK521_07785, partial [bacterium]
VHIDPDFLLQIVLINYDVIGEPLFFLLLGCDLLRSCNAANRTSLRLLGLCLDLLLRKGIPLSDLTTRNVLMAHEIYAQPI